MRATDLSKSKQRIQFGRFALDVSERVLARNGRQIRLAPKVFDTLVILVRNAGHIVRKEELIRQVWPDTFVEENNLDKNISVLRKALGEKAGRSHFITTVPKQGYRFTADISKTLPDERSALSPDFLSTHNQACLHSLNRSGGAPAETFVSRESELSVLCDLMERARSGFGRIVFVTGEPGIGKTALLDQFSVHANARDRALILAVGRCLEHYGTGEAYLPFLDALSHLFSGPHREHLASVLPVVAPTWCLQFPSVFGSREIQEGLRLDTIGATKERMLRELGDLLERLSTHLPVVLLLEDLHWADPSTIDLVRLLGGRVERQRLLLVGTFRPEELDLSKHPLTNCRREMQAHRQCDEIALGRFSRMQVSLLVDAHFTPNVFPAELATLIHRKTEGHPLFASSLLQYLRDRGYIGDADGKWTVTRDVSEMGLDVPETAAGMIHRKLDALDEEDRRTLQYAAIEGEEFTSVVLAALLGIDELDVEEKLDRLCRVYHLVHTVGEEELPDGTLATRYRFTHVLYQQFLYTDVLARRRVLLHRRVGEELLNHHADQASRVAAQLAMHFERGRDFGRAIQYLACAGDNATALYGYAEADWYYSHALGLIEKPSSEERFSQTLNLYHKRGLVRFALSRFDDAVDDLTKMTDRARLAESPALECNALNALSHVLFFTHRLEEMGVRAGEALRAAERSGNEALRALSLTFIARRHISLGDLSEARPMLEESIRIASMLDDRSALAAGLGWRGTLHYFQSEFEAAERALARALDLSSEQRDGFMVVFCGFFLGLTRANLGRISEALASLEAITRMSQRNGERYQVFKVPNTIGWIHRELGDSDGALAYDREGLDIARTHHILEIEVNSAINLAHDHAQRGDTERAEALFAEAANLLQGDDWLRWRFALRLLAASCEQMLLKGDLEKAEAHASRLVDTAERFGACKYAVIGRNILGAIGEVRGDLNEAEAQLTIAVDLLRQHPVPLTSWKTYAALGRIRLRSGNAAGAREAFEEAASTIHMLAANVDDEKLRLTFLQSPAVSKVLQHSQ